MATAAPEIPSVARARARAFEVLYRRHVQDVYRYTLAILRNPADAEDVTQTTFMNAYRAYMAGTVPLKPQNWLIKIAHNAARTRHARAARRVREVPLDDHLEQLAVPEEDKPDVREVLDALGRLPLNQRAALVMRELEGRSYAEIADTLGVSVPAVETLIFRARRSLRVNASAVRVLGVVPLPSSLSQLFNAGGIVAGGGTAVGSGFLLKAAVAVVAGVVATGVGGDHQRRPRAAVQPAWGGANGQRLSPDLAASVRAAGRAAARPAQATGAATTADPAGRAGADDAAHETALPGQETGSAPTAAPPPSTTPATPATTTSAVTGVTGTVTDATGSVTTSVPSVEPPPVELPPLPSVPGLPVPPPSLPSLP